VEVPRSFARLCLFVPVFVLCTRSREDTRGDGEGRLRREERPAAVGVSTAGAPSSAMKGAPAGRTTKVETFRRRALSAGRTVGTCTIRLQALVGAREFRGPGPLSPALRDTLRRDPRFARSYRAKSHGDRHLRCSYVISVNGVKYQYDYLISNTFRRHTPERCSREFDALLTHLFSVTDECRDLSRGAYYGYTFRPLAH